MARSGRVESGGGVALGSGAPRVHRVADERAYLYDIIETIGAGPDLETILRSFIRLVTEATRCHACFVYFVHGDRLVLRAASSMYAHLERTISIPWGEGLTGWVAKTRRSAFIKERALEDPRVQRAYFPELGDEVYQSLVSVPIFSRGGDVIGVITLHAEAPHEFARADLEFLEHSASLIAGAVENARLYEEAQARIALLTELSRLSQRIAAAPDSSELLRTVVLGTRQALGAARCEIYLLEGDRLVLATASPERIHRAPVDARSLWLEVLSSEPGAPEEARRLGERLWGGEARGTPLFAPLVAGEERIGVLAALVGERPLDARSALGTIAAHTAVAISQHRLIERLRETTLVKDFFDALAQGDADPEALMRQATRLGFDLGAPYVAVHVMPWEPRGTGPGTERRGRRKPAAAPWQEFASAIEGRLAATHPGSLFDRREVWVRGAVPVGASDWASVVRAVEEALPAVGRGSSSVSVGISDVHPGGSMRFAFEEASSAAEVGALMRGGPGVSTFEDLGPYRYLIGGEGEAMDRRQRALTALAEYDERRGTRLLETLEAFLDRRGNVVATSRALYIHPNTLRQRLARIRRLTRIDPTSEDWLSLAIATKLVRLRRLRRTVRRERERGHVDGRAGDG